MKLRAEFGSPADIPAASLTASANVSAFPPEQNRTELVWNRWPKPTSLSSCDSARMAPAAVGMGAAGGVGQTDRQTDRLQCGSPTLSLLPARVSLVHMPYAVLNWTLGLCAEASDRAHRRTTRVSPKRNPAGGGRKFRCSVSCPVVLQHLRCSVERARGVPSVKGTAASCRQHSRGSSTGELPDASAHFTQGFVVLLL